MALVDDKDAASLLERVWYLSNGYAVSVQRVNGRNRTERMHRVILNAPLRQRFDHINRNKLDNRRANLRPATNSENMQNITDSPAHSVSKRRNVTWAANVGRWRVRLVVRGKSISLGSYETIEEADRVAREGRRHFMTHAPESGDTSPEWRTPIVRRGHSDKHHAYWERLHERAEKRRREYSLLVEQGWTYAAIGRRYGVTGEAISKCINGITGATKYGPSAGVKRVSGLPETGLRGTA